MEGVRVSPVAPSLSSSSGGRHLMAQILPSLVPFDDYVVYGPYLGRKGAFKRRMVTLKKPGHTTTMAYARYLMCVKESRWLEIAEQVDHIDDDRLNDSLDNLQVLTPSANTSKNRVVTMVTLVCPGCMREFTRERRRTHLSKGGSPSCCSHKCAALRRRTTAMTQPVTGPV